MSPLLKKEIRLLLPAWGVALLLAAVPLWALEDPRNVWGILWVGGIGAMILSVSAFGREFALGTVSSMFTQPVSRGRLFCSKAIVLCVALATVVAALWFSYNFRVQWVSKDIDWRPWMSAADRASLWEAFSWDRWRVLWIGVLAGFSILAGGLWTVLVFRQMVASFWIAVLVPTALFGLATWTGSMLELPTSDILMTIVLLAYSALGCLWAWHLFKRAEDREFSWGTRTPPTLGELAGLKHTEQVVAPRMPLGALVKQEVSLHQTSLFASIVLLVLNLVAIGIRASGLFPSNSNINNILEPLPIFWFLIPLMLGASAIAEERRLGTLQARLCLPVSRRRQFAVKFCVATGLGLIVGIGALLLTDWLGRHVGVSGLAGPDGWGRYEIAWLPVASIGLTLLGLYASSLSKSALQALGTAILLAVIAVLTVQLMLTGDFRNWVSTAWIPALIWAALGLTIIVLSYRNFSQLQCGLRQALNNALTLTLVFGVTTILAAGVFYRTWELLLPLEPDHGSARIFGGGQAKIAGMWGDSKLLVLLPDGRLWTSQEHSIRSRDGLGYELPTSGAFLATSNWTDIASCGFQAIALRSDGTLWSICHSELINERWKLTEDQPRQVGAESNWVGIAAGQSHLLALKDDGTLWGWGGNSYSQVCEGPDRLTNGPVRIGLDSDWVKVFARRDSSIGVKRDGSSWQWGRFYEPQGEGYGVHFETYSQPVRWDVDLGGVRKLVGNEPFDLLLNEDGTLWAVGQLFYGILGTPTQPHYASEPVEVGGNQPWRDVTGTWNMVAGINQDGRLCKESYTQPGRTVMKSLSTHGDWLAVQGVFGECIVALGADGTLVFWSASEIPHALVPSRRPLASINIFDELE